MREIYLDNAATTQCSQEAAQLVLTLMREEYGNPSSLHRKGLAAQIAVDTARGQIAQAIGCKSEEVLFTHGGTEANNLAILGAARALHRKGKTIVAASTCHSSVRAPLSHLGEQGFHIQWVDPLPDGNTDLPSLLAAVNDDTILVCLELVGSETGAITPVAELTRQIRRKNKLLHLHCDGVQALGKLAFSASKLGVDSLAVSAHKIRAPKGCGALFLRKGARLLPLQYGGGQERGLVPGTESVPLIGAFGLAAHYAWEQQATHLAHVASLREHFVNLAGKVPGLCINSPADSTPYIGNVSLPGYRSETMLHFLAERGIYLSSGSACSKGAASHVLTVMKLPRERIDSALRISFSPENTKEEIDILFAALQDGIHSLARSNG